MNLGVIAIALFCAFLGSVAQIELKAGIVNVKSVWGAINWNLFAGLALYVIAMVLYLFALNKGKQVSVVYSIIATSYIWTGLLAFLIFKEPLSLMKLFGIALIVIGVTAVVS